MLFFQKLTVGEAAVTIYLLGNNAKTSLRTFCC